MATLQPVPELDSKSSAYLAAVLPCVHLAHREPCNDIDVY